MNPLGFCILFIALSQNKSFLSRQERLVFILQLRGDMQMFDKNMYKKIHTVSCTLEELKNFVSGIDKKELDLNNAFQKYYSLECILSAIKKYKAKQISDKYLAYWACAYNWIVSAGFCFQSEINHKIQEVLIFEISDWLDSLSFFDETEEVCDIEKYISVFSTLDKIYKNINDWEFEYAPTNEFCDESGDIWLLLINLKEGLFLKLFHDGYGDYSIENQEPWSEDDINKAIQSLKANGYKEMPYTNYDI